MGVFIEEVAFVRYPSGPMIGWNDDAIGVQANDAVNIRVKLSGSPLPNMVTIKLESRAPNQAKTLATMSQPKWFCMPKAIGQGPGVYYHSLSLNDVGDFLATQNPKVLQLAMLHRANEALAGASSSYLYFEKGGNWVMRGVAELPTTAIPGAGNEIKEIPAPLQLLRAGGVEVLQATVMNNQGWKSRKPGGEKCSRLVRSPADVFYYTGHAKYDAFLVRTAGTYQPWYEFKALQNAWPRNMDTDVLVIAGCNALSFGGDDLRPLLLSGKGPLRAVVGYAMNEEIKNNAGKAPRDNQGGDNLAKRYAVLISKSQERDYVKLWMDLHKELWKTNHVSWALTAAALDSRGQFWQMNPKTGDMFKAEEYNQQKVA